MGNVKILFILRLYRVEMYKLQSDSVMVPFRHSTCVYRIICDSLLLCLTKSGFIDHIRRPSKVLNYLSMIMIQLGKQLSDRINMWTVLKVQRILIFWRIMAISCLIILCTSVYIDDHCALLSYEMTTTYRVLDVCKVPHNLNIVHVRYNNKKHTHCLWLKIMSQM